MLSLNKTQLNKKEHITQLNLGLRKIMYLS